jgi:hypothetical protein
MCTLLPAPLHTGGSIAVPIGFTSLSDTAAVNQLLAATVTLFWAIVNIKRIARLQYYHSNST